ncbi:receptor-type tyrosine-protein phosphatase F-like [Amphiura filiformis]|uniref:receptor-type tyrosine-protein phosphatase F-like n=1 Tax=Amphiura filiformis TaxID=82378 RepID=UPI003B224EA2
MASLRFLIVVALWISVIRQTQGQCPIQNFQVIPDPSSPSSQLSVLWQCEARDNDFQITYQLTNRDQCDTGDGNQQPPFDVQTTGFSNWDDVEVNLGNGFYWYSTIVTGLLPYSTYTVAIQSRRRLNEGDIQSTDVTTGEAVPSRRPASLYAIFTTHDIDYSWSEILCGSRHGNITGYEYNLTYTNDGQPVSDAVFTPITFSRRPGLRVTGLSCAVQYTFNVAWKNNAGAGARSGIIISTTSVSPGSVQNMQAFLTATQITITWTEPAERGCPAVDTYEVTCEGNTRHEDECQDVFPTHTVMDTTSSLSYVCDVRPFYSYNIRANGIGGPVLELSEPQLTSGLAPSAPPGNVRIAGSSDTTRTITWDEIPCSDRNGQILGYRYELTLQNTVIDSKDVTTTSVTITLDTGNTYIFSIAGRTDSGIGPYTHITINTLVGTTTTSTFQDRTTGRSFSTSKTSPRGTLTVGREEMSTTATIGMTAPKVNAAVGQGSTNMPVIVTLAVLLLAALITIIILGLLLYRARSTKGDSTNYENGDIGKANNTIATSSSGNVMNTAYQPDNDDMGYEIPPTGVSHQVGSSSDYEVTLSDRPQSGQHYEDLDQKSMEKGHQYQSLGDKRNMRK